MPQFSGKHATSYAVLILVLTVLLSYFLQNYEIIVGGLLVTVFFTVFIEDKYSTLIASIVSVFVMTGMVIYLHWGIPVMRILTEHFFSLLLLVFTIILVSYLKRLQQHLSFEKNHMTSLFENATEGIILTNSDGKIILVNPSAEKMFGYRAEELLDNKIEVLIPRKIREKHVDLRDGFYKKPDNRSMGSGRDLYAQRKNGENFPVEVSLSHYSRGNEMYVIAFVVDITRRKQVEENLIRKQKELEKVTNDIRRLNTELEGKVDERTQILKEALEKLEKSQEELKEALDKEKELNEIKSRFVSMASHEFRTPLSTVLSSASLLSKYTLSEEQEKRDRHVEKIKSSVKNLNDILEDFLSLGKLDEGRIEADPAEFNLNELIGEIVNDMKLHLKKGQEIHQRYEGEEIIFADKKILKNIFINLLSNAIKFSGDNSPIELFASVKNGQAVSSVTDHGIGISSEDQKHLFSSFFRGANAANIQGTGLGLHIVKRYVDLLNGEVDLQSKLHEGTKITITIPVSKQ